MAIAHMNPAVLPTFSGLTRRHRCGGRV